MNNQIRHVGYFLLVLFLVLFVQLNNIQVVQAGKLAADSRNNREAVRDFSSDRGVIQTADGVVIAKSVPTNDAYKQLRQYPKGALYGQLTGFFSFTYGNEGLEKQYNKDLTGHTYALTGLADLLKDRINTNNLTITVVDRFQEVARQALGSYRGSVVALNPKDGSVLAMYSNPSYDPGPLSSHDFTEVQSVRDGLVKDKTNPMLPRSYRETFPPGSTFKVVTASAAYDRKPELTTKRYPTLQALTPPNTNRSLRNFGGETCGGTLPDLLRVSCNTGFAQMGLDMGAQNLYLEAKGFGFNSSPPLDMPSVAASKFPSVEDFKRNLPALAYSAIGQQDVSASPLQMALVAAGIANGGVVMRPHLLKEVRNNHSDVVKRGTATAWSRATSPQTAKDVTEDMKNVARAGTATAAQIPGITVAAKTGTAQTSGNNVHAWLIAFAPAEDPQVAVAVIVENQPGVSESTGGRIAAPIAKQVMSAVLATP